MNAVDVSRKERRARAVGLEASMGSLRMNFRAMEYLLALQTSCKAFTIDHGARIRYMAFGSMYILNDSLRWPLLSRLFDFRNYIFTLGRFGIVNHCMGLPFSCWQWLMEEVVGYAPRISALECEQFCTRHIEDLPSIEPHGCVVLSIRLFQMRPNLLLA